MEAKNLDEWWRGIRPFGQNLSRIDCFFKGRRRQGWWSSRGSSSEKSPVLYKRRIQIKGYFFKRMKRRWLKIPWWDGWCLAWVHPSFIYGLVASRLSCQFHSIPSNWAFWRRIKPGLGNSVGIKAGRISLKGDLLLSLNIMCHPQKCSSYSKIL